MQRIFNKYFLSYYFWCFSILVGFITSRLTPMDPSILWQIPILVISNLNRSIYSTWPASRVPCPVWSNANQVYPSIRNTYIIQPPPRLAHLNTLFSRQVWSGPTQSASTLFFHLPITTHYQYLFIDPFFYLQKPMYLYDDVSTIYVIELFNLSTYPHLHVFSSISLFT